MSEQRRDYGHWILDKRIPLAIIFAIVIQSATLVSWGSWWASNLETRVVEVERRTQVNTDIRERVIRVEVILDRLEKKIDAKQ